MARQIQPEPTPDIEGEVTVLRLVVTQLEERIEALEIRGELTERQYSLASDRVSERLNDLEKSPS